jgi:hypothetical protein
VDAAFVPGIALAERYYLEVVRPLLDRYAPRLAHSAALIGWGSDVLSFDSPRSADHNWGPRCQIFVGPADAGLTANITAMLAERLPASFGGWPTRFPDATAPGTAPRHWVEVAELREWLKGQLGFDPRTGVSLLDWLATPTQVLAEVTGGAVFCDALADGPGELAGGLHAARMALAWYPDDVWRYVLACQWARVAQEEAFPGRCTEAGDDLGSAVVIARLVRDLMRLVLLMRRRYPPYSKWLGSALARLTELPAVLRPALGGALGAHSWPGREQNLCAAYEAVAAMHNELGLTAPLDTSVRPYYDRPYRVIGAERFVGPLRESISADEIRRLPPTGAVDQHIDSTDALGDRRLLRAAISVQLRSLSTATGPKPRMVSGSRDDWRHDLQTPRIPRPPCPDPARGPVCQASSVRRHEQGHDQVPGAERTMAPAPARRLRHVHRRTRQGGSLMGGHPPGRTRCNSQLLHGR